MTGFWRGLFWGVAFLLVISALKWQVLPSFQHQNPFLLYSIPICLAAWQGGFLAGAITSLLAGITANLLFMGGRFVLAFEGMDEVFAMMLWLAQGLLISGVTGSLASVLKKRRIIEQEWRESEGRFRAVADIAPVLIWMAGPDGSSIFANKECARVTGLTQAQLLEFGWKSVIHPEDLPSYEKGLKEAAAAQADFNTTFRLRDAQGDYRWMLGAAVPRIAHGELLNYIGCASDITAVRQAQEELRTHATELEREVVARTASLERAVVDLQSFSYTVSHNLRAPLRAMESFARILLTEHSEPLNEEGKFLLGEIERAARRMNTLTRDLLNYSRISQLKVQRERVELAKVVDDVLHLNRNFEGAEIRLRMPLHAVLAHEALLQQCFANLLENAIKFTPPGTKAQVIVRTEKQDHTVRIWIEDNAGGIEGRYLETIFEPFEQLDPERHPESAGIGLAIVRKAVQRMGGHCGVESQLGQGSRFWIELPFAPAPARPQPHVEPTRNETDNLVGRR